MEDEPEFDFNNRQTRADQIFSRFKKFHIANPQIWLLFQRFAFEVINRGYEHYSADAIFHRIRWHVDIETKSDERVKLNDHYPAYYARLFCLAHKDHADLFNMRKRTSLERSAYSRDIAVYDTGPAVGDDKLSHELSALI